MEKMINEAFDKITMEADKKREIRNNIAMHRASYGWVKGVACAAFCLAALFVIPQTRAIIAKAADYVVQVFHSTGGDVIYEQSDNEMRFTIESNNNIFTEVEQGKVYLNVVDKKIDITDYCDGEKYYRYEIPYPDGSKSVILAGGTLEQSGWIELLFDENGTYVFNRMNVPADDGWSNAAMHSEGVPCGDPELDKSIIE